MNLNNRKVQSAIVIAVSILIFIIWALAISNSNKNFELARTEAKLEQAQAPKNLLLSYEEERVGLKGHEEYLKNELVTIKEWIRFVQENVATTENKIRCQRAVVVWAEKWDCEDTKISDAYLLR